MSEYSRPGFFSRKVLNPFIAQAARLGLSLDGANVLTYTGEKSGKKRSTPVNPLTLREETYLVAPRGDTFWSRALRSQKHGTLRIGFRRRAIRTEEVGAAEKPAIIAAYLERWGKITRAHFGTSETPDAAELERLAARTPVFRCHFS